MSDNRIRRCPLWIITALMLWLTISLANADQQITFQSDKQTVISHKLLVKDGRVLVADQEDNNLTVKCYDRRANLIWTYDYTGDYVAHTAGLYWIDSLDKIVLMLKKEDNVWEVSFMDDKERSFHVKETISSIQVPILLNSGMFFISNSGDYNTFRRLGWDGRLDDVIIAGSKGVSVVWWESKNVAGGYILVVSFDHNDGVREKALYAYNDQHQQLWAHFFDGDYMSTWVSDLFMDEGGNTLVWIMKNENGKSYPHIMKIDAVGELTWKKRVLSQHPCLSSAFISQNKEGDYSIWGTTGSTDVTYKLELSSEGDYQSHEYRRAINLINYIDDSLYGQTSIEAEDSISFVPVNELPIIEIDIPIALIGVN